MTKYIDLVPVLSTLISHFVIIKSTRQGGKGGY